MIKVNITIERPRVITKDELLLLHDLYGLVWMEAYYDPDTADSQRFALQLVKKFDELNKTLKFKT